FFAIDLPHSDACFVQAYPAETAEAFCDGHNAAFTFFGKVPRSILYDNTTLAVARILGGGVRQRTRVFSELHSHYVFEDRFVRPDTGYREVLLGGYAQQVVIAGGGVVLPRHPRSYGRETLSSTRCIT